MIISGNNRLRCVIFVAAMALDLSLVSCSPDFLPVTTSLPAPCPRQASISEDIRSKLQRLTATLLQTPALTSRLGGKPITLLIADAATPQAYSCGTTVVVLSAPLLTNVAKLGELAFIIAHEAAHLALNHSPEADPSSGRGLAIECEADEVALAAISQAGFAPQDGVAAILHFEKERPEALRLRAAALMRVILR